MAFSSGFEVGGNNRLKRLLILNRSVLCVVHTDNDRERFMCILVECCTSRPPRVAHQLCGHEADLLVRRQRQPDVHVVVISRGVAEPEALAVVWEEHLRFIRERSGNMTAQVLLRRVRERTIPVTRRYGLLVEQDWECSSSRVGF